MDIETLLVVISYNNEKYIENCLRSILNQNYKSWFLVVLDNSSKDETVSKIKEFRNYSPGISPKNFKFIPLKKNAGFAGGINYAVFNFTSKIKELDEKIKYLILINPDLYLLNSSLENLILTLKNCKDAGVVGSLILDYYENTVQHLGGKISSNLITSHIYSGKPLGGHKEEYLEEEGFFTVPNSGKKFAKAGENRIDAYTENNLIEADYVTGALLATKYKLFKKLRGFDRGYRPAYFEELDYCMRIKKIERKVLVNPASAARHAEAASSSKFSKKFYFYYHKNRIRCAVINLPFVNLSSSFIKEEFKWIKAGATPDQKTPLLYAYFLNFVFFPYNMIIKLNKMFNISKIKGKILNI